MKRARNWLMGLSVLVACSSPRAPIVTSTMDAGSDDGSTDAGDAIDAHTMSDAGDCTTPLIAPTTPLRPVAGELFYAQLGLSGLVPSMGEAALLVGPDGTVVLIDVANNSHDDNIADALETLTGNTRVDHVVITHFHADHAEGIGDLLGRITLTGSIVYRGFTDLTAAADNATIQTLCEVIAAHPSLDAPLCESVTRAPCAASSRTGSYPATSCSGLTSVDLSLGASARLNFVAANGFIGSEQYGSSINASDSNGENARSVVGLIEHGAFRILIAGDLTGGGSDTDDLESFYASRLTSAGVPVHGVDVLHAGHHGRDTSTNATWVSRLLPAQGVDRNVVMGISQGHAGSPHAAVLSTLASEARLGDGRIWTTHVPGGATSSALVNANEGHILIGTINGGAAYAVQAVDADGALIDSRVFRSVGACPSM